MSDRRTICWVSAGAPSAVAAKMTLTRKPDALLVYCDTGSEHESNRRFLSDLERWTGKEVVRLRSAEYADTWAVWQKRRYMSGINGAPCTVELKVGPRLEFQRPTDIHVFGYTADLNDMIRAQRLRHNYPELTIETPLIDGGLNRSSCLAIIERAGIDLPDLYGLGFPNNNCIPCVKATSPAYWALVRQHFPEEFERAATLSREIGARLARVGGERVFIDEVPADQPTNDPEVPVCDFLCAIAEQEMA